MNYLHPPGFCDCEYSAREPEPITDSERLMAYAGAFFLISVTFYLVTAIWRDARYDDVRLRKMLERCRQQTADAGWCHEILVG